MRSREYEDLFPPCLRNPEVRVGTSIPRIIAPGVAFYLTYTIKPGIEPDPEELAEFERELDICARFLAPRVRASLSKVIQQPES